MSSRRDRSPRTNRMTEARVTPVSRCRASSGTPLSARVFRSKSVMGPGCSVFFMVEQLSHSGVTTSIVFFAVAPVKGGDRILVPFWDVGHRCPREMTANVLQQPDTGVLQAGAVRRLQFVGRGIAYHCGVKVMA